MIIKFANQLNKSNHIITKLKYFRNIIKKQIRKHFEQKEIR